MVATWQQRVWIRDISVNEEFTVRCTHMHPTSANPFKPPLLSHQSMQHKPLCMQLAGQTGWKWLQFSSLIAFFCTEQARLFKLSITSWHININECVCYCILNRCTTQIHALTQYTHIKQQKHISETIFITFATLWLQILYNHQPRYFQYQIEPLIAMSASSVSCNSHTLL